MSMDKQTILLSRSDVARALDLASLADPLREAFRGYSAARGGPRAQRVRSALPGPGSATVLFPGTAPGVPAYTVKVHAKFPAERPAIRGVLCLHDEATGRLLAVMDSTHLTAARTGLAGAIAADALARPGADEVAVIGAGAQGEWQLRALAALRPIRRALAHDADPARAEEFAERIGAELGIPIEPEPGLAPAAAGADILLVATWAREPFLHPGMLRPGAHVTTLGADEPGKAEASAALLQGALFVCDDRELALGMGAAGNVGLGPEAIDAELGEVLSGAHPGRTSDGQITVYGGVGLPFQDAVAAWRIYREALALGIGSAFDFLS